MIRIGLVAAGIACGALLTSTAPARLADVRAQIASLPGLAWLKAQAPQPGSATDAERHDHHDDEGAIKLSDQQIAAAGIDVEKVQAGVLTRRRFVPGLVTPSGDRIARVAVRLLGTVVELRKRLGDPVEQDEV
jgi:cobalt-zinc-cadmium efflux system membrane fusion protein